MYWSFCPSWRYIIVVYAKDLEEHGRKTRRLLQNLSEANLTLQPDKCEFLRIEVAYLRHIIYADGVKSDPKKTIAVKKFPKPTTPRQIKSFLGLVGYYRKFIRNFAEKAKPLTELLKKNAKFIWGREQKKSFRYLRKALCKGQILQYPNFDKSFKLTTDASDYAISGILSQEYDGCDLPVCYLSRTLLEAEQNYFTTEKEW